MTVLVEKTGIHRQSKYIYLAYLSVLGDHLLNIQICYCPHCTSTVRIIALQMQFLTETVKNYFLSLFKYLNLNKNPYRDKAVGWTIEESWFHSREGPKDLSLLRLWEPPSFFTTVPVIHILKKVKQSLYRPGQALTVPGG